ncbi:MAG: heat shock protein, partial [Proteobacteria bacterium]|nr:heat shock protein [Pseudomonadota bacterium]
MKLSLRRTAATLAAGTLVAACTAMSSAPEQPALSGTAWVLSSLPGRSLLPDATARVQGTDGCNRYTAPYTETGSALQVGPRAASTQMACPPAVMQQAEAFTGALALASRYRVAAGRLQLLAADGAVLATLAPQSQGLAGTSWRVTGYNNGKQAVVSVLADTSLTMAFSAEGKVSGSAGCNHYTASYASEGQKLSLGPAAATRKMCASPERIMEQE